jgi:rhodanese-related sulfurtransferase
MTFPIQWSEYLGHWGAYGIYVLIGFAFGFVLEIAGFGNSKRLAAQFYFKDMTVLKVMFSAIVVAMVLIFLATGLGLLDYNLIWVNPTYWLPGIVGGLIMGFGFIIGGFCPGTSLVAAATLKLDGIFFTLGGLFGIFLFGETVSLFEDFFHSTYEGRYTVPEFLGLDTNTTVLILVLVAIAAFFAAEQSERIFGGQDLSKAPKWRYSAAGGLVLLAVGGLVIGQPTTQDRWNDISAEKEKLLEERAVQIEPAELLTSMHDDRLNLYMLDVRSEADYNRFHLLDAEHVNSNNIAQLIPEYRLKPANTLFVIMSNDEVLATDVWKELVAESVLNVYILEGGVNNWISTFADTDFKAASVKPAWEADELAYTFDTAIGSRQPMANPNPDVFALEFIPKITMEGKRGATSGGCG